MTMCTDPETNGDESRIVAHRAGVLGLCVLGVLAVCGVPDWWEFLGVVFHGYSTSGSSDELRLFSFFLWVLPSTFGAAMLMFTFGWRSAVSKVVLTMAVLLLVTAVVAIIIGAR